MRPVLYTGALVMLMTGCTGTVEAPDEGTGSTSAPQCTSQVYWKDMEKGSELMHPGRKCINCHETMPTAPTYKILGTVYPTLHEPDECNGVTGGLVMDGGTPEIAIVITDRTGRTLPPIPVNKVGNFTFLDVLMPFNVKVVSKGKENKMVAQSPHGDCNACHTQNGDQGAPGRVTIPQ